MLDSAFVSLSPSVCFLFIVLLPALNFLFTSLYIIVLVSHILIFRVVFSSPSLSWLLSGMNGLLFHMLLYISWCFFKSIRQSLHNRRVHIEYTQSSYTEGFVMNLQFCNKEFLAASCVLFYDTRVYLQHICQIGNLRLVKELNMSWPTVYCDLYF